MFMLGLGPIIVVHNRTGNSFSDVNENQSASCIMMDQLYLPCTSVQDISLQYINQMSIGIVIVVKVKELFAFVQMCIELCSPHDLEHMAHHI